MLKSADRLCTRIGCLACVFAASLAYSTATAAAPKAGSAGPLSVTGPGQPSRLNSRVAWDVQLPSSRTVLFSAYCLLNGRLYALGTDGVVISVRADSGEVSWMRKLVDEGDVLYAPTVLPTPEGERVIFAHLHDVMLFDATTGVPVSTVESPKPIESSLAAAPGRVFLFQPGGHLTAFRLRDGYAFWQASFDQISEMAPVYVPGLNLVVAADAGGLVAAVKNVDRTEKRVAFKVNLRSRPIGQMAVDGSMAYLATVNQLLHAIDLEAQLSSGEAGTVLWQYRLPGVPQGGPVLSRQAIYQAIRGGGIQRLAKVPGDFRGWFDPQAVQFLAEWPEGVVVLRSNDTLALIDGDPAHPVAVASADGFKQGISNGWNDAVYLTNAQGTIRCIRPAQAGPISLASFRPTTAPAAEFFKERETAIDKIRRLTQEKRDKREGGQPVPQLAAPSETSASQPAAEEDASVQPQRDPLRSNIPVVK